MSIYMISLLNLYGALGEKRAAEAPRRGAGWYKDPALRCYYDGRGNELWSNQHQLRQPERMAVALRPSHPARSARMRTRTSAKGKTTRIKDWELFT